MHSRFQTYQAIFVIWTFLVAPSLENLRAKSTVQTQEPSISQVREEYVMRFLEPAPHMALAKYFRDKGNPLQAFYILETARRGRFEEDEFNKAFASAFGGSQPPDSSQATEVTLLREHAREPNSIQPIVKLADIYISRENWKKAEEYILKAIQLQPEDFENIEALAEVFHREGKLEDRDRLLREYAQKYSGTLDGYRLRIGEVAERDPDKAKLLLLEANKKFPQEGSFVFDLGTTYTREGKLEQAEEHYVRAAEMSPNSVYIQAWVGRFFYKIRKDERRALNYYLRAYFLDPHAYETEFVESRIGKANAVVARVDYERLRKSGVPLIKVLEDPNPAVVYIALEEMSAKWDPAYLKILIDLMGHDDSGVRWYAMQMIADKVNRSFDETLRGLLNDSDLRKRGLAAYIAVHLWKQDSFGVMRAMLKEESQLLRFDAVSALMLEGGAEGRAIVSEHLPHESQPSLRKLIESALKPEKN